MKTRRNALQAGNETVVCQECLEVPETVDGDFKFRLKSATCQKPRKQQRLARRSSSVPKSLA
jgi:hypothetical protein